MNDENFAFDSQNFQYDEIFIERSTFPPISNLDYKR